MKFKELFTDLKDYTESYDKNEIESSKFMVILSYIGLLCLIPYFAEKNNKFVRFHAVQGLNLFLVDLIYCTAYGFLCFILAFIPVIGWLLIFVLSFVTYAFFGFRIWGIVNVCNGKAKELPVVNKLKLIKN